MPKHCNDSQADDGPKYPDCFGDSSDPQLVLGDGCKQQKARQTDRRGVQLVGEIGWVDNKSAHRKGVPGYLGCEHSFSPSLDQIKKVPNSKYADDDNLVKRKFDRASPHRCTLDAPGINSWGAPLILQSMWVPINEVSATHTDTAPEVALSAGFICLVSGMAACALFVCIVAAGEHRTLARTNV